LNYINNAHSTIDLSVYQMNDPNVINALKAAAQRGVAVRVMMEPKPAGGNAYATVKPMLTGAGVSYKDTPPNFDSSGNVDHAKFMVIDSATLLFGTGNLDVTGLGDPATAVGASSPPSYHNRDFWTADTRSGPVTEAKTVFNDDWNRTATTSTTFSLILT